MFRGDCEWGLHCQIAVKKPLLKDTNNKKRLVWAKKHEQWNIRPVEICPLVWWVQSSVGLSFDFKQDNDTKYTSRLCKGYLTRKESDGVLHLASTITRPQPNWDGFGWVGTQSDSKAANKCSAYVGTPSWMLEKHSRWIWLRECQERITSVQSCH
jgi:hypothetical protein